MKKEKKLQVRGTPHGGVRPSRHAPPGGAPESAEVIYGRRPVFEVLRSSAQRVERVFCAAGSCVKDDLLALVRPGCSVTPVERGVLDEICAGGNHQGVCAQLGPYQFATLAGILDRCASSQRCCLVVLDEVADPQNLGAILRAAEVLGAGGVVITKRRSATVTASARRASAGASEFVPVCQVTNLQQALEELKRCGFWVAGTSLGEDAVKLSEFCSRQNALWSLDQKARVCGS